VRSVVPQRSDRARLSLSVQYATGEPDVPARSRLRAFAQAALERSAQVTLRLVDEAEGRRLNRDFRGKDYPTNVLTFVYDDADPLSGDVVLCAPVIAAEARSQHKALEAHYAHLVVHGMLHLQGYDHDSEDEAAVMEARETEILGKLRYADPYAVAFRGGQLQVEPRRTRRTRSKPKA
jgi:probable rRNA maturation factor